MRKFLEVMVVVMICSVCYAANYNYPNVTVRDTGGYPLGIDSSGQIGISGVTSSSTTSKVNAYIQDNGNSITIDKKPAATLASYAISADSTTATLGRNTNTSRQRIDFHNNGAQTVFISTYAATVTTNLYPLLKQTVFSDDSGYTGSYYLMTIAGQAAQDVRIGEWSY